MMVVVAVSAVAAASAAAVSCDGLGDGIVAVVVVPAIMIQRQCKEQQ